jgi:hypothetical protein
MAATLPRTVTVAVWDATPSLKASGAFVAGRSSCKGRLLTRLLKRIRGGLDAAGSRQEMTCIKLDADKVLARSALPPQA